MLLVELLVKKDGWVSVVLGFANSNLEELAVKKEGWVRSVSMQCSFLVVVLFLQFCYLVELRGKSRACEGIRV